MVFFKNFGATIQGYRREDHYFKFVVLFLLFLLLAFDQDLAMIYLLIMFGDYLWYKSDNFISFPLTRGDGKGTLMVYIEGLAALGLFLLTSTFLVGYLSPTSIINQEGIVAGAQSIFHLLATSTPILKGNKIFTLIGWGVLVPIIETSYWNGRLLEGLTTYAEEIVGHKISLKKMSVPLFMVMTVVAILFTLFHITAKGLETLPLMITFIFSMISSVLVIRHQELRGAIFLHIVTNTAAVASTIGWL